MAGRAPPYTKYYSSVPPFFQGKFLLLSFSFVLPRDKISTVSALGARHYLAGFLVLDDGLLILVRQEPQERHVLQESHSAITQTDRQTDRHTHTGTERQKQSKSRTGGVKMHFLSGSKRRETAAGSRGGRRQDGDLKPTLSVAAVGNVVGRVRCAQPAATSVPRV